MQAATKMKNRTSLILRLELICWIATAILLFVLVYPIYSSNPVFPFLTSNILSILVFFTLTRHIFLLKHSFLGYIQWAKVLMIVICIPLFIYLMQELNAFNRFADEIGIQSLYINLSEQGQSTMVEYTKSEYLFFGVGSLITVVIFPFRMLVSFWRTYNHGTT
jgi:hypothetical protein